MNSLAFRRLFLALAVLMLTVGCDRTADGEQPAQQVRLGYFPNLTHAQAVLGVESGEFTRALGTTELKTRTFNAGPSLIEALFAGQIDVGYVGPGPVLSANEVSRGQGLRVISGAAANGVLIVARPGAGISSMSDLKGKRIATPQHGNTQDIAARHYVKSALGQAAAKNVLAVTKAEQAAMMSRGQIDAAWVPEPWGSRLVAEVGAQVLAEEKDLWPQKQFALTVIITTPEYLQAHPEVIEQILSVHQQWTQRLASEPEKYADQLDSALTKLTGKKLPPGLTAAALKRVTFTDDPLPDTFAMMGRWATELGFMKQLPKLDKLFVLAKARGQ